MVEAHCQKSPSNGYNNSQPTIHVSENTVSDFNEESTCCSAETSEFSKYTDYINSSAPFFQTTNSKAESSNPDTGPHRGLSVEYRRKPTQATPIYILTQTIIC
jgi:hypothetical protein